jgi:hypothetical protein
MNECHFKVQLPGTFFCRNQRWWWRVRLPGENRVKSRSLRPDGAPCGTKSRKTAEALAFDLWQQALVAETEIRIRLEARYQSQEKAKAYADLVDRLGTRAERLVARQTETSKHHQPNPKRVSQRRSKSAKKPPRNRSKRKKPVLSPLSEVMLDSPDVDLPTSIVMCARCDCCATPFIPEVELSQIQSGQNLCSKCMYYLRDAEYRHKRPQPENDPI